MDTTTSDASAIIVWPTITEDLKHRLLMDLKENCRPPNSWIIYRKEASRGLPTEDSQNIGPISTFISYHWRSKLSKETKEEWGQLAHWLQTMHKQWFPSYKFSPKTKEQKAEIKHERKLQTKSVKALGPVSVGTSSRPQPYTNRPSTRTKRHCPSQSSASSLDSIITPPMPFIQVAGLSAPAPVSFPLMGQDQFASNTNDFTSYGFRTPLNESYNFMHSTGAATNPAIPVPNPQPTFNYMHGAPLAYPQAKNACFNISPAAYQEIGNWANANGIPFDGQVGSTFDPALGRVPDRAAYQLWGNNFDVDHRMMPVAPLAANQPGPLFLQEDPVWTQQALADQPTYGDAASWPTWDSPQS